LSFFWKLYLGYVILIGVTGAATGVLLSDRVGRSTETAIYSELQREAILLGEIARPFLARGAGPGEMVPLDGLGSRTAIRLTVIDATGVVLADSQQDATTMENHATRPEVLQAKTNGMGSSSRVSQTVGAPFLYVAVRVQGREGIQGYARAAFPLTKVRGEVAHARNTVALITTLVVAVAFALGFLLARNAAGPLLAVTEAVRDFAGGNLERRIYSVSRDEMGELARTFNRMADQLNERVGEIERDKNKLLAILGGMVEGVVAVDHEGRVVHINQVAGRILGISHRALEGKTVGELTRVSRVTEILSRCLREGSETVGEAELRVGGRSLYVELYASPLRDGDGEVAGAVVVLHDVTRLKRLQMVRRDFVANASHELKTPITAIRGLVETLIDDPEIPEATRNRFLDRIKIQSGRLSSLVLDLLTISRLESGERGDRPSLPLDFRSVVRESCSALLPAAEANRIRLTWEVPHDPVPLRGEGAELRQLTDNLLDNAIKYTPDGGEVFVSLEHDNGFCVLSVRDTGVGISPADQERIFERFYRVDKARSRELGGTGLGLAIVKHIAQALDGTVSVESELGQGSLFRIQLPLGGSADPDQRAKNITTDS